MVEKLASSEIAPKEIRLTGIEIQWLVNYMAEFQLNGKRCGLCARPKEKQNAE